METYIQKESQLTQVLSILKESELVGFDFETLGHKDFPGLEPEDASLNHKTLYIEGLALKSEKLEPVYIPFLDSEISRLRLVDQLHDLFSQDYTCFTAHNISFDAKLADYFLGARPKNKFCTLVGYWYIDENSRKDKVTLGKELFDLDLISYKEAKKNGGEDFITYAKNDVDFVYRLYHHVKEHLPPKLWNLAATIEMDFVDVLIDMCLFGTPCDLEMLKEGERILTDKALELEAKIYKEYGEFNLKSPQQLCEKLFGIKVKRSKAEGVTLTKVPGKYAMPKRWNHFDDLKKRTPSTDDKALAAIDTPIARDIQEHRSVMKLLNTYAIGYQKWVIDGKIHPAFNHVGAVTGRLSSSAPNMQNISHAPMYDWWLRDAIYAPPGCVFVVADESQLEMRILGHFSQDPALMEAIFTGKDIHLATAIIIFGHEEVTAEERRFAKTMNFAIVYGQGVAAIAETLKISIDEAKAFRTRYFKTFPGIKTYTEEVAQTMRDKGYVKTLIGRRRRIREIYSSDKGLYARARRQTVNSIIQGSASDVLKVAMVRINEEFKERNLDAHILLQIHDELVIQCAEEYADEVAEITKQWMEHPFKADLRVPLSVEPKICHKWSEGK